MWKRIIGAEESEIGEFVFFSEFDRWPVKFKQQGNDMICFDLLKTRLAALFRIYFKA